MTGLPCSGKSTIARELADALRRRAIPVVLVDGDEFRALFAPDLTHTAEDRRRSLERYISFTRLLGQNGISSVVAVTNHTMAQRSAARRQLRDLQYIEVWIDTPSEECERRDVKGMYSKARRGELRNFVGVDIEFEPPRESDVRIVTQDCAPEEAVRKVYNVLIARRVLNV